MKLLLVALFVAFVSANFAPSYSEEKLEAAAGWLRSQPEFKGLINETQGEWCFRCPSSEIILDGYLKGAYFKVHKPANWNGILLVWVRGYTPTVPDPSTIFNGIAFETFLTSQGYALAGSLFSAGGWAVKEGTIDTLIATAYFYLRVCLPQHTIIVGNSMGSVISYKLLESPLASGPFGMFDGSLALCSIGAGATDTFGLGLVIQLAFDALFGWDTAAWGPIGCPNNDIDFATDVQPIVAFKVGTLDPNEAFAKIVFLMFVLDAPLSANTNPADFLGFTMFYATQLVAETQQRAGGCVLSNEKQYEYEIDASQLQFLELIGLPAAAVNAYLASMNSYHIQASPKGASYLYRYADFSYKPLRPVLAVHTLYDDLIISNEVDYYNRAIANRGAPYTDRFQYVFVDAVGHCNFTPQQVAYSLYQISTWVATGVKPDRSTFLATDGFLPDAISSIVAPWEVSPVP